MRALDTQNGGFTLLETVIVLAVMSVVMLALGAVATRSADAFAEAMRLWTLEREGLRISERLASELRSAEPSTLEPLLMQNSNYVSFQRVTGFADDETVLSPKTTIAFRLASDEKANGIDDNGDGLVDEGHLIYAEAGQSPIRLASRLTGLRFTAIQNAVRCAFDVASVDPDGEPTQATWALTVSLR